MIISRGGWGYIGEDEGRKKSVHSTQRWGLEEKEGKEKKKRVRGGRGG